MSMPFQELTEGVIATAIEVRKTLKPGLDEKPYERALCIEFEARGITFSQQPKYEVSYKDKPIGLLVPDLIVEDTLIVSWYGPWETPHHPARLLSTHSVTSSTSLPLW